MFNIQEFLDLRQLLTLFVSQLPNLISAILILVLFWFLNRFTRKALMKLMERTNIETALSNLLINSVLKYTIGIIAMVMAAAQLGINVGAALASIGIAGIAIGFAAQDSLANTIAGFMIFWDKPFHVGDWITVCNQYGCVSEVTLRSTRIRTNDNKYVVLPNKMIIDDVLINHSKNGATRVVVKLGIAYKEDIAKARKVLLSAIVGHAKILDEPSADLVVMALDSSSINLELRFWTDDFSAEDPLVSQILEISKEALDQAGIEIPFPHLQLFIDEIRDTAVRQALDSLKGE
jgi:small conductance mechanosensitive channel